MSFKLVLLILVVLVLSAIVLAARRAPGTDRMRASNVPVAGPASVHPELEFFNDLSGVLRIELDTPARTVGKLQNLEASPTAAITHLTLEASVYEEDADDSRPLTFDELDRIGFGAATIRLRGEGGPIVEHHAPNGSAFTVRELLRAVEQTERQTRGQTEWLGGVDVHHIYFEGIHPDGDGVCVIRWGS
jgi:hypothetical protein